MHPFDSVFGYHGWNKARSLEQDRLDIAALELSTHLLESNCAYHPRLRASIGSFRIGHSFIISLCSVNVDDYMTLEQV